MKIKGLVTRECKHNGKTYETIEITKEDIEKMLIKKCMDLYSDNDNCIFDTNELEIKNDD